MGTKYSIAAVSLDCLPECAKKSFLYKQRGASRAFWRGSMSVLVSPFLLQSTYTNLMTRVHKSSIPQHPCYADMEGAAECPCMKPK